ncbi:MAG: tRNA epoxyqueuosine(34) reductase QueG [Planctomycetota bacterium]|nr:tRNA epoxyqueuosine(34) reductase QueG [Planctomycetota bacterium]MCX8040570.1 tRNA epoxyqueuosine(34) reductase QueG [Planctomycetota bacterium]MDW8372190.1 tRNA epoxyqueuosine(34) reductase QueG [Planctomycetota bacterium]
MTAIDRETLSALCRAEGLYHLATLAPVPEQLSPERHDLLAADGVGDMRWLLAQRALRLRPTALLPSARALLCVALHYAPAQPAAGLRRAAYAAGADYHRLLRAKLARVGRRLDALGGRTWRHRACVDSAPLDERTLAAQAGLGWIGRNALLISPRHGSYRLLGFLLTEAPLPPLPGGLGADRCGSCTRCEQRCPTRALLGRRCLSERCISYLTIEHRGVIPRELAARFAGWWFGCDLCQEVCPWNRFAPPAEDARLVGRDDEAALLALRETDFARYFAGRAIRRLGWARFRRNLIVALFSLGRGAEARALAADGPELARAQAAELGL